MKRFVLISLLSGLFLPLFGQTSTPILERKVTVKVVDQTLGKVLNIISETADFNFSYNNSIVKTSRIISIHAENRSVKEVLDQVFENTLSYQQIGNHLVLQKKPVVRYSKTNNVSQSKPTKYHFLISGYVRDIQSGDGVQQVSIYEKATLQSTVSGDFGYYKIETVSKDSSILLHFSRADYRDTSIRLHFEESGISALNINLISENQLEPETEVSDSMDSNALAEKQGIDSSKTKLVWTDSSANQRKKVADTKIGSWLIGNYQKLNDKNIRDSFERDWQLTLIPPLGTNGNLSSLVTNRLSFNVFAGYNGGLEGAEFGGLFNIIKKDVVGAQFAGIGNIVGRRTEGAQFAGIFNFNIGEVNAFQAAGIYNYNHQDASGVQLAGIANFSRKYVNGVQGAGILNFANTIDGGQVAGILNVAHKVRSFQIGLINVADTNDGIAIGILNFIRNGLHQIELSANESEQYGLAYRSGTGKFYSNVMMSTQLPKDDSSTLLTYGFGIGTSIRLSKVFKLTADISSQQMTLDFQSDYLNLQNRLCAALEVKLFKGFAVFGGLTLNHMLNDTENPAYESRFKPFGGSDVFSKNGRFSQKAWTGFQFGLRIL